MAELNIDRKTTALVVIDLQKGIVARGDTKPHPTSEVVGNAVKLADAFRKDGMPVFLVRVSMSEAERLKTISDTMFTMPPLPPDWAEITPELGPKDGDIIITKRQWGAFYGTDLELQLRRRGIDTIVLSGISTIYGVESTARTANEMGFQQLFAEDAMSDLGSAEAHNNTIEHVFKRIGRVRKTAEILAAIV
ncbi:MAG TPA: hydrolase [Candidatus Baltobacteraceae bacterium]|nr:hydrolase [Candidatus Baltobacteraceae bacterium]